jgi:hypothetical protein
MRNEPKDLDMRGKEGLQAEGAGSINALEWELDNFEKHQQVSGTGSKQRWEGRKTEITM